MTADKLYDILVERLSEECPILVPLVAVFISNLVTRMGKLSHLPIERGKSEVAAWLRNSHPHIMERSGKEILQWVDAELRAQVALRTYPVMSLEEQVLCSYFRSYFEELQKATRR
ncbi:hypothetical protein KAR91_62040 [Candidatus Pacearchaeota archaeon]|nr:hypothetical protein [Candidatus Pacearchaeota archaeon]